MRRGLFRKQEKAMLVAIDRQLRELHEMVPEIRDLLRLRTVLEALHPLVAILDALGAHVATLDALGAHVATLDALGAHVATLDALGPRLALIDSMSATINDLSNLAQHMKTNNDIAVFADLVLQLRPIVENYLEQNHLVAENVRVDVETVAIMMTALQVQITQLQKAIENTRQF